MYRRIFGAALSIATVLAAHSARAQDANCTAQEKIDRDLFLRRLSLDLLGRPPTAEEYDAIEGAPDVTEEAIDKMLASDGFVARVQRFVADLVYPSPPNYLLGYNSILLPLDYNSVDPVYWRQYHAQYPYDIVLPAGVTETYLCVDEPAPTPAYDQRGEPLPLRAETISDYVQKTYGYVEVEPYWARGRRMKVCSFDARELALATDGYSPCDSIYGSGITSCGCGPDLRWCSTYYDHLSLYGTEYRLLESLRTELDWAVRRVVSEDRSWIELFTARETFLPGPLAYFFRNQRNLTDTFDMSVPPVDEGALSSIAYDDPGQVVLRGPRNAGILTSSIYLLRHQTARARVNRFDTAFLCQPYSPPSGGIGDLSSVAMNPNLAEREKCSYCHARLEVRTPAFGMLAEVGGTFLDTGTHPEFRQDCFSCAASSFDSGQDLCDYDCSRNYYIAKDGPRDVLAQQWGKKKELAFRSEDAAELLQRGPQGLVQGVEPAIGACLVTRMTERFFHRGATEEEAAWMQELADGFVADGYRLRPLVKRIVTSKMYRRAP